MNDTFRLGKYCVDNRISLDDLKRLVPVVKQEKEQEFKTSLSQMDTLSQQKVKTEKLKAKKGLVKKKSGFFVIIVVKQ